MNSIFFNYTTSSSETIILPIYNHNKIISSAVTRVNIRNLRVSSQIADDEDQTKVTFFCHVKIQSPSFTLETLLRFHHQRKFLQKSFQRQLPFLMALKNPIYLLKHILLSEKTEVMSLL